MVLIKNIRKSICEIGKLLFERELVDSSGGNLSVRDGDKVYINPRKSGHTRQWILEEDEIIVTDLCQVPLFGNLEDISREAATHYIIYQNFEDIKAIIHAHPIEMMVFGAAHKEIPAVTEGSRIILGEQPIGNTPEVLPGSIEQAEEIVKVFKKRRGIDPEAPLICGLPFHGIFVGGADLNDAFMYAEVANNAAKILIYRKMMFGDDPTADLSVHKHFTKDDWATIEHSKEVCNTGYKYKDAFGNMTSYGENNNKNFQDSNQQELIEKIAVEVIKGLKE